MNLIETPVPQGWSSSVIGADLGRGTAAFACVFGAYALANVGELAALMADGIEGGLRLVVDLSRAVFMDASVRGALVAADNSLRGRSPQLAIRAPSPPARRTAWRVRSLCCGVKACQQPRRWRG